MPLASIGRRRWLQVALGMGRRGGRPAAEPWPTPAAVTPIRELCDSLLGIMRAGTATPFEQRFATLAPVDRTRIRPVGDPATVGRADLGPACRRTSKRPC